MVKLKPRTNILLDTGGTFLTMLETIVLHLHRSLHSPTTQASTTQLEKPHMKLSLGPNHKSLCPSNWDFIGINTSFAVQFFVKVSLLIHIARTAWGTNCWAIYFKQNYPKLLERERTFKQIFSWTFERCREQTARSHAYRNRFKLGHHLEIGQKVLNENQKQDLTRSQKLQQRRLGPLTVTRRITNNTYQIQDDKDPTVIKTVHRNHLVEYYPKEGSLPAMIEEYVPPDRQNDNFSERFMEQRTRDLNNPSTTEEHDSFPFPMEPLRSFPSTTKPKRSSMHSNDSGISSPLASSRTPVLSPAIPIETSTPHPCSSQQAQTAQLSPREHLSPIQQLIRNSATPMTGKSVKLRCEESKYIRSWPDYPDPQSVMRTRTRQCYKLWSPLYYYHVVYNFSNTWTNIFYSELLLLFFTVDDSAYPLLANATPAFLLILTERLQKTKNIFVCCAIPKKKAVQ